MRIHVHNVRNLLYSLKDKETEEAWKELLLGTLLAIDSCFEQLEKFPVSNKSTDIRKARFETLSKHLSQLAIFCSKTTFESLQGNIHFFPLDLMMSPSLQHFWAEKAYTFLIEQDFSTHNIYTDASIKHDHYGSFSGVLTLASGHILHNWNYQLQEAITNSSTCELIAIIFALCQIMDLSTQILIQTDSEIAIGALLKLLNKGEQSWHFKKNPLLADLTKLLPRQPNIKIQHVKAHANCSGNHFADRAACFAHIYGKELQWKAWALETIRYLQGS
ncbi:hypothetical protein DSO57_1026002 [Entomophthora muscae]|uniref:Uncharacterized protein n=1 Tax=Entomophthora muscae TaxID=34485 RepID=A0ACC2S3W7_9FUNG|nr:hypothetical protein DSO57_1026002 [Entomophthora muscae]